MDKEKEQAELEMSGKETSEEKRWRMVSVLAYVIVLIGFGVPIWWHTTKVYRAALPLDEMILMKSVPASQLQVFIHASTASKSQLLVEEIENLLSTTVNASVHNQKITLPVNSSAEGIETAAKTSHVTTGAILLVEWPMATAEIVLTSERLLYFNSEISGHRLAMFLIQWPGVELKTALVNPNSEDFDKKVMRPFVAGPKYDILITIVNPEPQYLTVEWDVKLAIQDYLQPFLNSFSMLANFTVKSQWLYLMELGVSPRNVGDHWALAEQLLPHIISPLEKKLSSHVSKNPCINLVVYVPPCRASPIHIYTRAGVRSRGPVDAFVSPRWGGVLIANPKCPNDTYILDDETVMSTFITHLHQLLGIPNLKSVDEVRQVGKTPSQWQKDYLMRAHSIEYSEAARLSLRSLAQLLSEISNIVINYDVAESVRKSVFYIARSQELMAFGDVVGGFKAVQLAALYAEAAFSDPSLLALLYFPDDQKYAVYIPLFLPIMIPVVISMGQLIKWLKQPKSKETT